jgi:6-oxo-cyclohex-1-ene-carbonyl-CoA hydrolase
MERAMMSGTLCESWSAHRFYHLGGLTQIVPVLRLQGKWIANPLVVTDRLLDEFGRVVLGEWKTGPEKDAAKKTLAGTTVDLQLLDEAVEALCTKLLYTMPDCLTKTIESLRKHKLEHWDRNRETNRAWLALNMMTEANAGFRAFHYGTKDEREVDFVRLRQRLAEGAHWSEELIEEIAPWTATARAKPEPVKV